MKKAFTNAEIFTGWTHLKNQTLYTLDDRIKTITGSEPAKDFVGEVVDLGGDLIIPGFLDCQVNGGGGVLFNDWPTLAGVRAILSAHQPFGTVAMLPTLISDTLPKVNQAIAAVNAGIEQRIPGLLGIHLEGPFLNAARKGVHDARHFTDFDKQAFDQLTQLTTGKTLVTLAPECVDKPYLKALVDAGVIIFAGHTQASFEQIQSALTQGLSGFTHLFNAMSPLQSREPGVVGAALADEQSYCGIIVDGHHVHDATLKIAMKAKAQGKVFLVTDAMPSVGAASKKFRLNGELISVRDGVCKTAEGVLAGSDLNMFRAVKNTVALLDGDWQEAVRMASIYPAACLGVEQDYGVIKAGTKASFVVVDKDFSLRSVWVEGHCVSAC